MPSQKAFDREARHLRRLRSPLSAPNCQSLRRTFEEKSGMKAPGRIRCLLCVDGRPSRGTDTVPLPSGEALAGHPRIQLRSFFRGVDRETLEAFAAQLHFGEQPRRTVVKVQEGSGSAVEDAGPPLDQAGR